MNKPTKDEFKKQIQIAILACVVGIPIMLLVFRVSDRISDPVPIVSSKPQMIDSEVVEEVDALVIGSPTSIKKDGGGYVVDTSDVNGKPRKYRVEVQFTLGDKMFIDWFRLTPGEILWVMNTNKKHIPMKMKIYKRSDQNYINCYFGIRSLGSILNISTSDITEIISNIRGSSITGVHGGAIKEAE